MSEGLDRCILVVDALKYARTLEVVDCLAVLGTVLACEDQLSLALFRYAVLGASVEVAVSVTGYRDRLLPVADDRLYSVMR